MELVTCFGMFLECSGHYHYMGYLSSGVAYVMDPFGTQRRKYSRQKQQLLRYAPRRARGRGRYKVFKRYRAVMGPKRMQTRLRFANQFVLDAGAAGASANFVMSANGMFDPELGAGTHQPRGFDQYMAMWTLYGVVKASITVQFAQDSNTDDASICGIMVQDNSTVSTSVIANMEHYDVVSSSLGRVGSGGTLTLKRTVKILQFLGRGGDIADDDDLQGSSTLNPTDGVFFIVFSAPLDPAIDNGPINCICYIDYWVDLFQRIRPPASDV